LIEPGVYFGWTERLPGEPPPFPWSWVAFTVGMLGGLLRIFIPCGRGWLQASLNWSEGVLTLLLGAEGGPSGCRCVLWLKAHMLAILSSHTSIFGEKDGTVGNCLLIL